LSDLGYKKFSLTVKKNRYKTNTKKEVSQKDYLCGVKSYL